MSRGTTVVAAAGNLRVDASQFAPANCNNVITVGATDEKGARADFSNFGDSVDIWAPGTSIVSTSNSGKYGPTNETVSWMSGT